MSGIAGIYYLDGRPVDRADLQGMVDILAHRGPDGAGVWHEGPVGLGHRMLHTTPESLQENLPLVIRAGDLAITADARIDNREELLASLDFPGRAAGEIADSELILAAYEKWGESCPEKLLGDFAFAIRDKRRQTLFCARDHMGVKPFYYYGSHRIFVLASEIKALHRLPEVPRRLHELSVGYFLQGVVADESITFYEDILRLPPGHSLTVSPGQRLIRPYWELDPTRELRLKSDEEYAEAFREVFTQAVRCRLRSAFPVGSELSGGMDSSSVVCVARELLSQNGNRPLKTFSAIFDEVPECDERRFIQPVLAQGRLEPHFIHPDRVSPLGYMKEIFWHHDEPPGTPVLFIVWDLCRAASQQGVRVLLDGVEGDIAVSLGLEYLRELLYGGRWLTCGREVRDLARRFEMTPLRCLWHCALKAIIPEQVMPLIYRSLGRRWWEVDRTTVNPGFAQRIGLAEQTKALARPVPKNARHSRAEHWLALTNGGESYALEVLNKSAAAFGVELRHPFYDRRVVEFCLALPGEQKLNQGWNRMIVRRALSGLLPPQVCWRGNKTSYAPGIIKGLLRFDRDRLEEALFGNPGVIEEYVNLPAVRRDYQQYVLGKKGDYYFPVWKAATLSLWLGQENLASGEA